MASSTDTKEPLSADDPETAATSTSTTATDHEAEQKMRALVLPIRMQSTVIRGFGRGSSELGIPTANLDCQALFNASSSSSSLSSQVWSVSQQSSLPSLDDLPTGIYWGYARIGNETEPAAVSSSSTSSRVYTAAISIGYNPTYGNAHKTVEPHLIAPPTDPCRHSSQCGETVLPEFYGQAIRLSVCGYLRPELPFEGLDKLIQAIKHDIVQAQTLGEEWKQQQQQQEQPPHDGTNKAHRMAHREHEWVASLQEAITAA